jgi:hypothetical protein
LDAGFTPGAMLPLFEYMSLRVTADERSVPTF